MSATLGNIVDLKKFLNAEVFSTDFRPVELKEYVKVNDSILELYSSTEGAKLRMARTCNYKYSEEMRTNDPDCLAGLVQEVIPDHSCLVFCPTKKNCENVALLICKGFSKRLTLVKAKEKQALMAALSAEGNGLVCQLLSKTIPYGIAYHHSGLTMDERRLIEEGYSNGTLCCLACTTTLAAGVNLPAKRVIVRSPYVGCDFISRSRYKQMVGRAGRAGIDSSGESLLIIKPGEKSKVMSLLSQGDDQCLSSLMLENGKELKVLILSLIGLEVVKTVSDVDAFLRCTLLNIQKDRLEVDLGKARKMAIQELVDGKLVEPVPETGIDQVLKVTQLGRATYKGCVNTEIAVQLYDDLNSGLQSMVLNGYLHLLYLVTPYDSAATIMPQTSTYYNTYMKLNSEEMQAAKVVGIPENHITLMMMGKKSKNMNEAALNRFYSTLILYKLWQQSSVWEVATEFQLHRGTVQNLLSSTTSFASCVGHFCSELPEFWAYQALMDKFVMQLSYCVTAELLPLMDLPAVKKGRASQLYKAGFKTLQQVAGASPDTLVANVAHLSRRTAIQMIAAAKMLVLEMFKDLTEQAEELVTLSDTTVSP